MSRAKFQDSNTLSNQSTMLREKRTIYESLRYFNFINISLYIINMLAILLKMTKYVSRSRAEFQSSITFL